MPEFFLLTGVLCLVLYLWLDYQETKQHEKELNRLIKDHEYLVQEFQKLAKQTTEH